MSYPSQPNYYPSSSNNSQNPQQGYEIPRESSHSQYYQNHTRHINNAHQSQYGSGNYGWSGSGQSAAGATAPQAQTNPSWQDRSNTANQYGYQGHFLPSHEPTSLNQQSYAARNSYNNEDTGGLHHLAYASGLEHSATVSTTNRVSQPQQATGYVPTTTAPTFTEHRHTTSSMDTSGRYSPTVPQPLQRPKSRSTQGHKLSSLVETSDLAQNAVNALAGAVQNRYSHSNQPTSPMGFNGTSNLPVTRNTQSMVMDRNVGSSSPRTTVPFPSNIRSASVQLQPDASGNNRDQSITQKGLSSRQSLPPSTKYQQSSGVSASNSSSIANLVTAPEDAESTVPDSMETQEPISTYVDPTKVFNPYYLEHEKRKREAVEAEAKRLLEEERLKKEKERAEMERGKKTDATTTANSKTKVTKKVHLVGHTESQPAHSSSTDATGAPSTEEAMAGEIKTMMSKMKEFRSTNPALFMKLWNDMRGGGANATATVPAASAPSHTPSPQTLQASIPARPDQQTPVPKPQPKRADTTASPGYIPPNGFKVVVENNAEGLPDLGRFPAERRIRHPYAKSKGESATNTPTTVTEASRLDNMPSHPTSIQQTTTQGPKPKPDDPAFAWPEPRRRAVAIAAIQYLKSNANNGPIPITAQEICWILEKNPSYLDLCTELEGRGLKFQRTLFAKDLLKQVPELQTPVSRNSVPAKREAATISAVAAGPVSSTPASIDQANSTHASHLNTFPQNDQNKPQATTPYPPSDLTSTGVVKPELNSTPQSQFPKSQKQRASTSNRVPPVLGAKEAAARKRDFAELIDLSDLNDNDNYVLPKKVRYDEERGPNTLEAPRTSSQPGFINTAQPLKFNPQPATEPQSHAHPYPQQLYQNQQNVPVSRVMGQPRAQQTALNNSQRAQMLLAEKMKKSNALQKSYYDPKTIARDVLIASGRHPSERPLNLHLAGMLGLYIELDSDVSTFEWDAIDPGGPPPPIVDYVDIPAEPPRLKLAQRPREKRKLTELIDKPLDDGKHRQLSNSKQRPPSPAPASVIATKAQETPQNAIIQPGITAAKQKGHQSSQIIEVSLPSHSNNRSARNISIDIPTTSSQQSNRSVSQPVNETKKMETDTNTGPKRRGRPPGSKNKHPSVAAMKKQAQAITVPKVYDEPPEQLPEPILHSYKCKWIRCHAELHNIDTLKRHVSKMHVPSDEETQNGALVCWWKKCKYLEPDSEGNIVPVHTFDNQGEWESHIQAEHIHPMALRFGDGPRSNDVDPQSIDAARTRYLADDSERLTTPPVTSDGNPDRPYDAMVLARVPSPGPKTEKAKADMAAQNAYMKAHGEKPGDARKVAEEVVRAMEVRKSKIGPGIERGGCTFMNEARRVSFIQEPGVSRIVDHDY